MLKRVKEFIQNFDKKTILVYFILRLLVILVMVVQILNHNWEVVFLCFLTLVLFLIPLIIDKRLKIDLPTPLEITILLFIFAAEILGEIRNFYSIFPHWDLILHTINGFLCAAIGFSLIDILNKSEKLHITLTPIFVAITAFCFSMTIGVLWEFFEYSGDKLLNFDMQKDKVVNGISSVEFNPYKENDAVIIENIDKTIIYYDDQTLTIENGYLDIGLNDTMEDLFVNFAGAFCFSIIGYLYIKNRDKYKAIEGFIPRKRK